MFKAGQKLRRIYINDDTLPYEVGKYGVIDIEIVFESGQMAGVAWARVINKDRPMVVVNLAKIQEVEFKEQEDEQL